MFDMRIRLVLIFSNKMAGRAEDMCSSCFENTKYTCLRCKNYSCMRCSVFENDESVAGWKAGSSVAYCESCFREKMILEETEGNDHEETSVGQKSQESSLNVKSTKPPAMKSKNIDANEDEDDVTSEEGDDNEDVDKALSLFVKKGKARKGKRPGRRPQWCPKVLDDFIDIVVNSNEFKTKLIFTNTKNQRNSPIYAKILDELKGRASARGDKFNMSIAQLRTKFKKCVSQCKQAALTQKTATGIKRYQEDHGFGSWFNALFAVVKTRDSCQPERALEPSSSSSPCTPGSSHDDHPSDNAGDEDALYIPKRSAKKEKFAKDKLDNTQVMKLITEVVRNDPTKEMISFLKDEMEKSREHELKLFQLMLGHRANSGLPPSSSMVPPSSNMETGFYQSWNQGFPCHEAGFYPSLQGSQGPQQTTQESMSEGSYGNPFLYGNGKYQTL